MRIAMLTFTLLAGLGVAAGHLQSVVPPQKQKVEEVLDRYNGSRQPQSDTAPATVQPAPSR
jgi:hypothetical protein